MSRRQILDGFVCPDDKDPVVFDNTVIPEPPELPGYYKELEGTFAESSAQRWTKYDA